MDQNNSLGRNIVKLAQQRMQDVPVLLINGARSSGKSFALKMLAEATDGLLVDLDQNASVAYYSQNPSTGLPHGQLLLIDEYQRVPSVLQEIKSRLNSDSSNGQYILTGSVTQDALPKGTQSLTGRIERINVYPFSQQELNGTDYNFIEHLVANPKAAVQRYSKLGVTNLKRSDYAQLIVKGGFPLANRAKSAAARRRWFRDYIEYSLSEDVSSISNVQNISALRKIVENIAKSTGSPINSSMISQNLGVSENTVSNYIELLRKIFMIHPLEVSGAAGNKRMFKHPKIHFVDSGIAASLVKLDSESIQSAKPEVLSEIGHLYETFAAMEVIKLASMVEDVEDVKYWRTLDQDEIDLVIELYGGDVIAIEIKSSEIIEEKDFRSIKKFQKLCGSKFKAGIILYSGLGASLFKDNLASLPLDSLWRTE